MFAQFPVYQPMYQNPTNFQAGPAFPPGAYQGSALENFGVSASIEPKREVGVPEPVEEAHPQQDMNTSEPTVSESNEDQKENSKCQLGIVMKRLPYSKVRSRFDCAPSDKPGLKDEDPVYLMMYIPEDSIISNSISVISSVELSPSAVKTPEFPSLMMKRLSIVSATGVAVGNTISPNHNKETLSYSEFNSYYYLLERIRKKTSPSADEPNFIDGGSRASSTNNKPQQTTVLNRFESTQEKSKANKSEWINLLEDKKVRISTVKDQFDGSRGQSIVLELLLLPEKYSGVKKYSNRRVHVELMFKFNVPNDILSYVKPRLKQEFDLIDASDKVITLLSRITMSNKWAACSPNTYGNIHCV